MDELLEWAGQAGIWLLEWAGQAGTWLNDALATLGALGLAGGGELIRGVSSHWSSLLLLSAFYVGYKLFAIGLERLAAPAQPYTGSYRRRDQSGSAAFLKFFVPGALFFLIGAGLLVWRDPEFLSAVFPAGAVAGGFVLVCLANRLYSRAASEEEGRPTGQLPRLVAGTAPAGVLAIAGLVVCFMGLSSLGRHVADSGVPYLAERKQILDTLDDWTGEFLAAAERSFEERPPDEPLEDLVQNPDPVP